MISIKYRIIYADTDQMGVVYHSNYFKFFEMCRGEMMRKNNLSYKQVEDLGFMLPIIESHCEYKLPAKYDDVIEIFGKVSEVKGIRVKIECEVYCNNQLLAKGYTIHICTNKDGKPIKVPEILIKMYEESKN